MADDRQDVSLKETPLSSIPELVSQMRESFRHKRRTLPAEFRVQQLLQLRAMIAENEGVILEALWKDLHREHQETTMIELNPVRGDLSLALSSIHKWMSPESVEKNLLHKFNSAYVQPEPYGVVLLMSPWNYPFLLCVQPLIGAIAAGNVCILKLSEIAVHTSNVLSDLLPKYLDEDCVRVITGGVEVGQEVLKQRFDYIYFTGNCSVGKIVMKAAAEHLTPVILELGGKSPCIVSDDANIEVAARRIIWGKCINAGQSCIAPDYVLCSLDTQERLVEACKRTIREFYGENPKESKDFGRIVSSRHYQRVVALLDASRDKVVFGGEVEESERYVSPTLITNVTGEDKIMTEEIFGPLLPFVIVQNTDEAIEFIADREKPLALYVFSEDRATLNRVNHLTSAGGVTHNDTFLHGSLPSLPFGGVGHSGYGAYHGKFSFDTFSHRKPVLSTSTVGILEGVNNIRYPPYSPEKMDDVDRLQGTSEGRSFWPSRTLRMLSLITKSAMGYTPHQQQQEEDTQ